MWSLGWLNFSLCCTLYIYLFQLNIETYYWITILLYLVPGECQASPHGPQFWEFCVLLRYNFLSFIFSKYSFVIFFMYFVSWIVFKYLHKFSIVFFDILAKIYVLLCFLNMCVFLLTCIKTIFFIFIFEILFYFCHSFLVMCQFWNVLFLPSFPPQKFACTAPAQFLLACS